MTLSTKTASLSRETDRKQLPPLRLPTEVWTELRSCAAKGYPHEVCGLLIGSPCKTAQEVRRITQGRNLATGRLADRYTLDPDDFVAADAAARQDGLEIVGIWHTHPDHPARPSRTDLEAAWEGYSYLILSVGRSGVEAVTSWRLEDGDFVEQSIKEAR